MAYEVTYRNYSGVTHEFFGMGAVVEKAKQGVRFADSELRESFSSGRVSALPANHEHLYASISSGNPKASLRMAQPKIEAALDFFTDDD